MLVGGSEPEAKTCDNMLEVRMDLPEHLGTEQGRSAMDAITACVNISNEFSQRLFRRRFCPVDNLIFTP